MQYFWSMELLKKIMDSQPDIRFTDGSPGYTESQDGKNAMELNESAMCAG